MSTTVALNPQQHANLRIRDTIDAQRFGTQQVVPVVVQEFGKAGGDCPVVFVKNATAGRFQPVQLVGLAQNENLMLLDEEWLGLYIPGALRLDPLRLAATGRDSGELAVAVDTDSPLVGETEGEALFDEQGQPTAFLSARQQALAEYYEHGQATEAFVARLEELDLLRPQELSIDLRNEQARVGGIYLVDEGRLHELGDEVLLELVRRGYLQAIHSHLMSVQQVRRLARLRSIAASA